MLFPTESQQEQQLLEDLHQAKSFSTHTEPLCDARNQLEEYYLRYRNWGAVGEMLLQDLTAGLGELPMSYKVNDTVKRLLRVGKSNKTVLFSAAEMLEKASEREKSAQSKADLMNLAGRLYEKIDLIGKSEESYIAAWKISGISAEKELFPFYLRNKLYIEMEEMLYQDYLRGDTEAPELLDQFYSHVIASTPAKYEDLSSNQHNFISRLQHFLSLPRVAITHRAAFPLPKGHLSLLLPKIQTFSAYLSRAKRVTRCLATIITSVKAVITAGTTLGFNPIEVINAYLAKSTNNAGFYCDDMRAPMLEFMGNWGTDRETRHIWVFLIELARKGLRFEEMERMIVSSKLSDWGYRTTLRRAYI